MGANVYLTSVTSFGNLGEGAASAIIKNIPGRPGERIAIRAFAFYGGATAVDFYFMQALGSTTLAAAAASGASEINMTTQPISGNNIAANDYIVVVQTNGAYHFSKVFSVVGTSTISLCTVLTGAAASGNTVYDLGIYSDTGHLRISMTATTETERKLDGGLIYADAKGYPMMLYCANDATTAATVKYLTVDYINK